MECLSKANQQPKLINESLIVYLVIFKGITIQETLSMGNLCEDLLTKHLCGMIYIKSGCDSLIHAAADMYRYMQ